MGSAREAMIMVTRSPWAMRCLRLWEVAERVATEEAMLEALEATAGLNLLLAESDLRVELRRDVGGSVTGIGRVVRLGRDT